MALLMGEAGFQMMHLDVLVLLRRNGMMERLIRGQLKLVMVAQGAKQ